MKKPASSERQHMERVAKQPCIACGNHGVQVHHIREGQGLSQRAAHFLTIPLCSACHSGALSIHMTKRQFEKIYGDELTLLNRTIERIYGGI